VTIQIAFMPGTEMAARFYRDAYEFNCDLFERIRYLHSGEMRQEDHFVAFAENKRVVGDLALQQSPYDSQILWLKHVSVDEEYRNQGIAGRLLRRCMDHLEQTGKKMKLSSFSDDGERYLRHVLQRLETAHPDVGIIWPRESNPVP